MNGINKSCQSMCIIPDNRRLLKHLDQHHDVIFWPMLTCVNYQWFSDLERNPEGHRTPRRRTAGQTDRSVPRRRSTSSRHAIGSLSTGLLNSEVLVPQTRASFLPDHLIQHLRHLTQDIDAE